MAGIHGARSWRWRRSLISRAYETLCDAGGATGQLSIIVANRHPHMRCTSFDLPVVEAIATRVIEASG